MVLVKELELLAPVVTGTQKEVSPRGARLLVVDDDPAVLEAMASILRMFGHDVTAMKAPLEALELLTTEAFDGVICDVMMPEIRGPTMIAKARAAGIDVRVVFVTGSALDEICDTGEDELLTKPFSPPTLQAAVQRMLERGS